MSCVNFVAVYYEFHCGGWQRCGPFVIAKSLTQEHAEEHRRSWVKWNPSDPPRIQPPDDPGPTWPSFTTTKVITRDQYLWEIS